MNHDILIQEMDFVKQLPIPQRVVLARQKRTEQLVKYMQWNTLPDKLCRRSKRIKFQPEVELLEACDEGRYEEVERILDKGVTPNAAIDGITALHRSCIDGNELILRLLLKKGASVNSTDADGWTPLHVASTCGHKNLVKILVESGADLLSANEDKELPFEIAENTAIRKYLEDEMLQRGVSQRQIDKIHNELYTMLYKHAEHVIDNGQNLDEPVTHEGATLLHVACQHGFDKIVRRLLAENASPFVIDKQGWMPGHVAAYSNNKNTLEIFATETDFNFNKKTLEGDTVYDLCDEDEVKIFIRQVQRERTMLAVRENAAEITSIENVLLESSNETTLKAKIPNDVKSEAPVNTDINGRVALVQGNLNSSISSTDDSDDDFSYIYYVNFPVSKKLLECETTNKNSLRKVKRNYPALGQPFAAAEVNDNEKVDARQEDASYKVTYTSDSVSSADISASETESVNCKVVKKVVEREVDETVLQNTNIVDEEETFNTNKHRKKDEIEEWSQKCATDDNTISAANLPLEEDTQCNHAEQEQTDSFPENSLTTEKINDPKSNTIDSACSQIDITNHTLNKVTSQDIEESIVSISNDQLNPIHNSHNDITCNNSDVSIKSNSSHVDDECKEIQLRTHDNHGTNTNQGKEMSNSICRNGTMSHSLYELKKRRSEQRNSMRPNEITSAAIVEDRFDLPMSEGRFRYRLRQSRDDFNSKIPSIVINKKKCSVM